MMRDFIIMTDSCCDLNAQETEKLELRVLPLSFLLGGKSYSNTPDHADMDPVTFFQHVKEGAECSTAAVNVGSFVDAMRAELKEGKDILCISFSSALSTTYQSACIAAEDVREEFPEATIEVIDSLCASRGQGLLLYLAAQEKQKGKSLKEVAAFVRETIPHVCHWFTVADLNHLKRGGRISATTAFVGTMLNIKPVMHTDNEGRLTVVGKARGMKAALNELLNAMERLGQKPLSEQTVLICHADCQDSVDYVTEQLRSRFGVKEVLADFIGPVIGSHTGCGTLGLFFLGTER